MTEKWFANRGQVLQLGVAVIGAVFSGIKEWPAMRSNEYLSLGAFIFYSLIALVLIALVNLLRGRPSATSLSSKALPDNY